MARDRQKPKHLLNAVESRRVEEKRRQLVKHNRFLARKQKSGVTPARAPAAGVADVEEELPPGVFVGGDGSNSAPSPRGPSSAAKTIQDATGPGRRLSKKQLAKAAVEAEQQRETERAAGKQKLLKRLAERKKDRKRLSSKTSKGQPRLGNQIEHLLGKLQKEVEGSTR